MTPPSAVRCTRVYTDAEGLSHFGDTEIAMTSVDFAPPAPPLELSEVQEARFGLLRAPAEWFGDWHPAPRRQLMCVLSGRIEVEVSDGERRTLSPGQVALLEDTTGIGHISRVVGDEPVLMTVAQLEAS